MEGKNINEREFPQGNQLQSFKVSMYSLCCTRNVTYMLLILLRLNRIQKALQ